MAPDWTIAPATPADVPGMMALVEECFSPTWRSVMLYGAPGAGHYAADLIRRQDAGGDTAFLVARGTDGQVRGFVEVRRLAGSIHMNNMATGAAARGQGVYAALMAEGVRLGRAEGYTRASCDVFVDNPIRTYLLKIGYRVSGALAWQAASLPGGPMPAGVYFAGLPQADAAHTQFGFSRVDVFTTRGAHYDVGRLGTRWFRVTDPSLVAESDVLVALHNLDPDRELLAIVPAAAALPAWLTGRALAVSERLACEIATVLPVLSSRAER
jgi:ribosomal protein S18 acetylase RimI-like enzyme